MYIPYPTTVDFDTNNPAHVEARAKLLELQALAREAKQKLEAAIRTHGSATSNRGAAVSITARERFEVADKALTEYRKKTFNR